MDIPCCLVLKDSSNIKCAVIPEEYLSELANSLATKGVETVHFAKESIEIQGVYIPAKGFEGTIMIVNK